MFIHLAIHHPKPEHADGLLASMHRVDQAAERIFQAVADDPFDQWLQQPPDVFHPSASPSVPLVHSPPGLISG
jgi:hypothetical protein